MPVSIAAMTVPNWARDADVVLRIYALTSFVAADGTEVVAGDTSCDSASNSNWFQSVACTVSGTTLHIPAVTLPSTTDSPDNPRASFSALFFTSEGDLISPFGQFVRFALPPLPASTTWGAIAAQGGASSESALASFSWAGFWNANTLYGLSNFVNYNGGLWYALAANLGETPGSGNSWTLILEAAGGSSSGVTPLGQVPSGTIDGTNRQFTISRSLVQAIVWLNFPLVPGVGYTLTGTSLTYAQAPQIGDSLYVQGF